MRAAGTRSGKARMRTTRARTRTARRRRTARMKKDSSEGDGVYDNGKNTQTLLDDEDDVSPEDEAIGMVIPGGFRLQESRPAALDSGLVKRGVLVRLNMGWFGGLITRKSQERTKYVYNYHVHLEADQVHAARKTARRGVRGFAGAKRRREDRGYSRRGRAEQSARRFRSRRGNTVSQ